DNDPWMGPLGDVNNRYLGVRFTTTNGVHYAWVRLVSAVFTAGVEEWAYEFPRRALVNIEPRRCYEHITALARIPVHDVSHAASFQ
ncbi:MAG: hypothetical protein NTW03_04140, partial [Verrucomicrobia bacterium]|nr:hypothetical protein [Verrucomicrobiota bacterium]